MDAMGDELITELDDTEGEKLTDQDSMLVTLTEGDELAISLEESSGELLSIDVIDANCVWLSAALIDGMGDGLTRVLEDIVGE